MVNSSSIDWSSCSYRPSAGRTRPIRGEWVLTPPGRQEVAVPRRGEGKGRAGRRVANHPLVEFFLLDYLTDGNNAYVLADRCMRMRELWGACYAACCVRARARVLGAL